MPLLLAACLLVCSGFQVCLQTPHGIQCPTAPIQKITVTKRDCCGRVVGYETRAPKPGEAGFMQCHCAEKKASQQAFLEAKDDSFFTPLAAIEIHPYVRVGEDIAVPAIAKTYFIQTPSTRPPNPGLQA